VTSRTLAFQDRFFGGTYHKARVRAKFHGISPQNMSKHMIQYFTVPPLNGPETLTEYAEYAEYGLIYGKTYTRPLFDLSLYENKPQTHLKSGCFLIHLTSAFAILS
jgi:hypothetical protein